jgi:hypothetical protein
MTAIVYTEQLYNGVSCLVTNNILTILTFRIGSDNIASCLGNIVGGHVANLILDCNALGDKTNSYSLPYLLLSKNHLRKQVAGVGIQGRNTMPTSYKKYTLKQGDKTLGVIDGDVLRIIKTSDEHFVRKYKGFGISPSTLDKAEADNCHLLEFTTPKNKTYIFPIADFRRGAIPDDLGFGRQFFMAERWMQWYSDKYTEACNPSPKQMELFVC